MNKTYGLFAVLGVVLAVALLAIPAKADVPVFNVPPYFLDDEYVYLDTTAAQNAQCEDVGCIGINRTQQDIDITNTIISVVTSNLTGYLKNNGDAATGNYTFDNAFKIDDTNNRVGVNTIGMPSTALEVNGSLKLSSSYTVQNDNFACITSDKRLGQKTCFIVATLLTCGSCTAIA